MPTSPRFPENEIAMDAAAAAVADYATATTEMGFAEFALGNGLLSADVYAQRDYLPYEKDRDVEEENLQAMHTLLEIAARDTARLYAGARQFLLGKDYSEDEALAITQRSRPMARAFGSVTTMQSRYVGELAESGSPIFDMGKDGDGLTLVAFSKEAYEEHIAPFRGRHIGCPVLARTVELLEAGLKLNIYDAYWELFCSYAHSRLNR